MIRRVFISSVQRELATERKAIVELISTNPQLARFFDTFAFEFNVPATDKRTDEVYLSELAGIIGNEYGWLTPDGTSATESEYDEATRLGILRLIMVSSEVGVETPEVGVETPEVGVETPEVGVEIDFDTLLAANRRDFRITCKMVWQVLAENPDLTQLEVSRKLSIPASSVQSACNALKEVGLLEREGARKNGRWLVKTKTLSMGKDDD